MTVQQFWQEVRIKEKELAERYPDGALFVQPIADFSKNSAGGDAVEVSVSNAAQLLTKGTHRQATAAEVETHKRHAREGQMVADAQQLRNVGGAVKVILSRGHEGKTRK